jgi:hypothetical protein
VGKIGKYEAKQADKRYRVVALADTHCGSRVGLAPPDYDSKRDEATRVRQALWECWKESTSGPWAEPDALFLVGDLAEGQNKKKSGYGLLTSDLTEQARIAVECLSMWRAKRVYTVRGSGYHIEAGHSSLFLEDYIAKALGGEIHPWSEQQMEQWQRHAGWHWYVTIGGVTFHLQHRIGTSRVFHYRTTPLAREMLQAKLNTHLMDDLKDASARVRSERDVIERMTRQKVGQYGVILRAHAHYFCHVRFSHSFGYNLPCWKALDDFMLQGGPLDMPPDIGFIGMEVSGGKILSTDTNLWRVEGAQPQPHTIVED